MALVYPGRVEAPARRQQRDLFSVRRHGVQPAQRRALRRFQAMIAFHAEIRFRARLDALVSQGLPGPGVGANHAAGLDPHPGVVTQGAIDAGKLHLTKLAAQIEQKPETGVHVIARLRQT
jgi:hypothetical protein